MLKYVIASLFNIEEPFILRYTTSDNGKLNIKADWFDADIVWHTYNNGAGQIKFNKPIRIIGDYAFMWCSSLTSVTIPNSVTTIGKGAFSYCKSLTSVTIPNSVTSIGGYAFARCSRLKSVYFKRTTPLIINSIFSANALRKIYVPTASVAAYKSSPTWIEYAYDIEGYDF